MHMTARSVRGLIVAVMVMVMVMVMVVVVIMIVIVVMPMVPVMMVIARHVFAVVPIVTHKVDRTAAGMVFGAMP